MMTYDQVMEDLYTYDAMMHEAEMYENMINELRDDAGKEFDKLANLTMRERNINFDLAIETAFFELDAEYIYYDKDNECILQEKVLEHARQGYQLAVDIVSYARNKYINLEVKE